MLHKLAQMHCEVEAELSVNVLHVIISFVPTRVQVVLNAQQNIQALDGGALSSTAA